MKRKVPFRESVPYEFENSTELRVQVDESGNIAIVDFDSSQLDLGSAELYDLTNMLKAGVQPGVAKPHGSSLIEAAEASAQLVDNIIKSNQE